MGGRVIGWNASTTWRRLFQQSTPDGLAGELWQSIGLDGNASGPMTDPKS